MTIHARRETSSLVLLIAVIVLLSPSQKTYAQAASAPKLSVHWEELTAADFREGMSAFLGKRAPKWTGT